MSLERSLHAKGQFGELDEVMKEYFEMEHAEPVPEESVQGKEVFYLPIHAVRKRPKSVPSLTLQPNLLLAHH